MLEWAGSRITDGTEQSERIAAALQPGYFNVDEFVFTDLLAMAAEMAANLRFYDLKSEPDGTWSELFSADEAVIMAMILSVDLKRAEAEFSRYYPGATEQLARYVMEWAERIDFWLSRLNRLDQHSNIPLRHKLDVMVREKLAVELHTVGAVMMAQRPDAERELEARLAAFVPAWGVSKAGPETLQAAPERGAPLPAQYKPRLRRAFYALHNAIAYLKTFVPAFLQQSLSSQQHAPAIGLYMAFLKLYERAQQRLNLFTQRHRDFYYHQVLHAGRRAQQPESVYLCFAAKPAGGGTLIGAATRFTAGKDEALQEIIYRTDEDLLVTDARIEALHTLHLQHDRLISPETQLGMVTRIKTASPANPAPQVPLSSAASWPLFGGEGNEAGSADAEIGFALASPLLLLQEGVRRIELSVWFFDKGSFDAQGLLEALFRTRDRDAFMQVYGRLFSRYLLLGPAWLNEADRSRLAELVRARLDAQSARTLNDLFAEDWQWLFYKQLQNTFSIRLTTAKGWLEVADYAVSPLCDPARPDQAGIRILFVLEQEMPPIDPCAPDVHGGRFQTEHPVLRCCINPQTHFYPYTLFQDFVVDRFGIQVEVRGLNRVVLHNKHGQLDPSKPFQPFGPLPGCHSYLVVGNYEIATKQLNDLKLNLEWGELPLEPGGLAAHYRDYPGDFRNNRFKGRFEALVDGQWHVREGESAPVVGLFDETRPAPGGRQARRLDVDLCTDLKPIDRDTPVSSYGYDLNSRNGFFRLVLVQPESAFGHAVYPQLLSQTLMQAAREKKPQSTPNPPYTPIINRLSLDYSASMELRVAEARPRTRDSQVGEFYHIHPFGIEPLVRLAREAPLHLFPQYSHEGHLFIGIDAGSLGGTLTLLFHLAEDLGQERLLDDPAIDWFYLTRRGWRPLPPARIHADSTEGFLITGRVTLDIPEDIARGTGVMPGDLYWLRVAADRGPACFSRCYAVRPHGVKLTRDLSGAYSLSNRLPEVPKWRSMTALGQIDGLWQAGRVMPGRLAETEQEQITRISERLRHKDRAVTPWDYERLVLEHFPQVAKVKCFSNMRSADDGGRRPRPGSVLVVVVPQWQGAGGECDVLMLSSVQLTRIRRFLAQRSSPFVRIEVRNPVYERIQVRCTVKFAGGFQSGYFVNRLNREISDYICPWQAGGYGARFGWRIRKKDIESRLRELDYVDFISNFSMLHISQDAQGRYRLDDTARDETDPQVQVEPRFPWSLALPVRQHFIETMTTARAIEPEVTGVDELEIGTTFIIPGSSENA